MGYEVNILEASSRVGGRVITFRDPVLAPGLHAEGGAMRIPGDHYLLHRYLQIFDLDKQLFPFEMKNKFIYLSGLPEGRRAMTYSEFDSKLVAKDPEILALFPNLKSEERGKTCDQLFDAAVQPVKDAWINEYRRHGGSSRDQPPYPVDALVAAYKKITKDYDKYTLRSYLTEVAGWSEDAINLYDLGNAHVVFENGFIESFKDAFLSSNQGGDAAGMQQLQPGMDAVPKAFAELSPGEKNPDPIMNHITFGARVKHIGLQKAQQKTAHTGREKVICSYDNPCVPLSRLCTTPLKIVTELVRRSRSNPTTSSSRSRTLRSGPL
jgi:monoamine oxidase